jgi:hypothetical protein
VDRFACGQVTAELPRSLLLPGVKQEVAGIGQMVGHETRGEGRVALFDRGEDRLMKVKGVFKLYELGGDHDHVQHCAMDGLKEPPRKAIARSLKDNAMEKQI